ncbi:hypothetical protein ACFVH0_08345 [Streptomyces sp. NPDC127117]|uniref:hypothetical protein n=1 Tax=Streptomyces sp. NPDC127117 TaxID=3345368 RepID=UPI00363D95FA
MTDDRARVVLGRLCAIDWSDDRAAYGHANSCALLMREYLRRAARRIPMNQGLSFGQGRIGETGAGAIHGESG